MSNHKIPGYVSLLYSIAEKPLELWSKHVPLGGRIRRIKDDTLHGDQVIEITGPHDSVVPTSITIPAEIWDALNIRLPVLILIVKNLDLRFKFEVQITDSKLYRRRFSFMTYNLEKLPNINANVARVPLRLEECWNFLEIDLQALCHEAYGIDYEALQRLIIYPNCYLRRVYLQDRHYNSDEIPVDMYQAFFNMYMSKYGVNISDKTCQTEEHSRGLVSQSKLIRTMINNMIGTLPVKTCLSKTVYSMGKLENLNPSNVNVHFNHFNVLKRKYMSLDTLNNTAKMQNKQNITKKQSLCLTEFSINEPIIKDKVSVHNNNVKKEIRNVTHKANDHFKKSTNVKNNNVLQSTSVERDRVAKSQFLKMHVSETLFKNNKSSAHSHLDRIQDAGDIHIFNNSKNCTTYNSNNNVQTKDNIHCTNAKYKIFSPNVSLSSEFNLSKDISKFDKVSNDLIHVQNNELYTIIEDKDIKKNEKDTIKRLRSTFENNENQLKRIQSVIDKETTTNEIKQNMITTETMTVRQIKCINKKFLKKLRDKGVNMPQESVCKTNQKTS